MNFVPALACHIYQALSAAFTQPGASILDEPYEVQFCLSLRYCIKEMGNFSRFHSHLELANRKPIIERKKGGKEDPYLLLSEKKTLSLSALCQFALQGSVKWRASGRVNAAGRARQK